MSSSCFLILTVVLTFHVMVNGEQTASIKSRVYRKNLNEVKHILDSMQSQLKYLDSIRNKETMERARVAFSARLRNNLQSTTNNERVIFDYIITNIGGAYSSNDGVFTAPRDGVYVFAWTVLTNPGKRFDTVLVVNGKVQLYNGADTGGKGSFESSGCTAVLKVLKGDKVWIRKNGSGGNLLRAPWSSFSGWNLY